MAEILTPIERKVYNYLLDFLAENTYQPSIREIGKKFRIKSTKTVSDLLQSLSAKGYIERDPSRSRGVRLVGYSGPSRVQAVPFYAKLDGGETAVIPENRAGQIGVDRRFVPCDDAIFVRVSGAGIPDRGILAGDFVLVSPSAVPQAGDIVADRHGDAATIMMYAEPPSPIDPALLDDASFVPPGAATAPILGVVCGVFRPFFDRETFEGAIAT